MPAIKLPARPGAGRMLARPPSEASRTRPLQLCTKHPCAFGACAHLSAVNVGHLGADSLSNGR